MVKLLKKKSYRKLLLVFFFYWGINLTFLSPYPFVNSSQSLLAIAPLYNNNINCLCIYLPFLWECMLHEGTIQGLVSLAFSQFGNERSITHIYLVLLTILSELRIKTSAIPSITQQFQPNLKKKKKWKRKKELNGEQESKLSNHQEVLRHHIHWTAEPYHCLSKFSIH